MAEDWARAEVQRRRETAAQKLAAFDTSLDRLSLVEPAEAPLTRTVIRETVKETLVDSLWSVVLCLIAIGSFASAAAMGRWLHGTAPAYAPVGSVGAAILTMVVAGSAMIAVMDRTPAGGATTRNRLIQLTTTTVIVCAGAHAATDAARPKQLRELDRLHRQIERWLLRASRTRRTMSAYSVRHAAARRHAAQVAGALRNDLYRLDIDPDTALPELARKLVTIGERYAEGRVGSLLPEEELEGVEPVSLARNARMESAHMVLVITAIAGGGLAAWTAARPLGLPAFPQAVLIALGAAIGGTVTGGWKRMTEALALLPGK